MIVYSIWSMWIFMGNVFFSLLCLCGLKRNSLTCSWALIRQWWFTFIIRSLLRLWVPERDIYGTRRFEGLRPRALHTHIHTESELKNLFCFLYVIYWPTNELPFVSLQRCSCYKHLLLLDTYTLDWEYIVNSFYQFSVSISEAVRLLRRIDALV